MSATDSVPLALAVSLGLAVVGLGTLPLLDRYSSTDRRVDVFAGVLVLAAAAVTVLRRRRPGPALIAAAAFASAYLIAGYPYGPILLSVAVCVYAVARNRPLRQAALWSAPALLMLLAHLAFDAPLIGLAPGTAWVVVPFTLGAARRQVVEAQARERSESGRRIADAERLRVAHEVHDVVGHGLAAIQMQADVALHLRDTRPELALEALETISKASSEALDELRATLAGLSSPGLSGLEDLCARVRAAGVAVDLSVDGPASPLPTRVDVAAYRVLQEALTNVVKHADQPWARVTIRHRAGRVDLGVTSSATAGGHTDGFGITGMRRRVEQLGGDLSVSADDGTFAVRASIPREHPS